VTVQGCQMLASEFMEIDMSREEIVALTERMILA
jgi:hypothetical protein